MQNIFFSSDGVILRSRWTNATTSRSKTPPDDVISLQLEAEEYFST